MSALVEETFFPSPKELYVMTHVHLDHHDAFYGIGDVHGDMFALLNALQLTGCVDIEMQHFKSSAKCWSHQKYAKVDVREGAELKDISNTITWKGGTSVIAFLGDVFDNRRSADASKNGVCSWSGTQFQMLDILVHLKAQAESQRGNVIWILGNHDIWNVSPVSRGVCTRYGAKEQTCTGNHCSTKNTYTACKNQYFSNEHRNNVRNYMIKLKAVAVLKITNGNTHVLALHGGMGKKCDVNCNQSLKNLKKLVGLKTFEEANKEQQKELSTVHMENILKINILYLDAIWNKPDDKKHFSHLEQPYMPTWCRPKKIDNGPELKTYFGTSKMIKAHDGQRIGANCNGKVAENEHAYEEGENDLCFLDVYMSRAFEQGEKKQKEFACIKLYSKENRLYRQILKKHEHLNNELEYTAYTNIE